MNDESTLEKEREVVTRLTEGMEILLTRVVAQRVVIEDLLPAKATELLEELESALMPKVHEELAEMIAVFRSTHPSTSPLPDWTQMVCDLVESSRDVPPPPNEK